MVCLWTLKMSDLDNIDRNILSQLLKNGRTTMENLSKKVVYPKHLSSAE
jgi:DNA-binding Lrp family transcriptional regulator